MPKNTRVYRCVKAVHKSTNKKGKPRYSYGDAIAICQASTKQNYRTGARISKSNRKSKSIGKRNRKSKTKKRR
jgi:hypothetical protein|tara:strand:- start:569 stop:787 length:219 start_codon:yes stop_codon:yes gene_type:complete